MSFLTSLPVSLTTILLLIGSNVFMTFAWYGHLKVKSASVIAVIFISWGIAFFEYCLMIPANRMGYGVYSAAQLKTIQEVITLTVFVLFSWFYLGEAIRPTQLIGFALIAAGSFFIFQK
ncbi:DMT family protein [Roseibium aestuarii]|uniref:DMT family protein n=1 Tax=Roseibium aestuarii TaxID=2600299 RepID=A0ABW4JUF9_9HYPH|nr:DMT family protein [Roseibium aestuarii]